MFAIVAMQLGACAALDPTVISSGSGPDAAPAALGLAPSISPHGSADAIVAADADARRLAEAYYAGTSPAAAPPPANPAPSYALAPATTGATIQDQPIYNDPAPVQQTYGRNGYGYGVAPQPAYVDDGDPIEPLNRGVFAFNDAVDTVVLEPLARGYRTVVPQPVRTSVRSFLANLESPITFANDLLQGELSRAEITLARFMFNTTLGVGGLYDFASAQGLHGHREDFDQTLAVYGVPSGPYMVVPILGPATPRHIVGRIVDSAFHPLTWIMAPVPLEYSLAQRAAEGVVAREEVLDALNETRANSVDYYVAIQSFYRQNRRSEINNGQLPTDAAGNEVDPYEGIDIDF